MKKRIRLTESQLHRAIKESVKKVLKEYDEHNIYNTYNEDDMDFDSQETIKVLNDMKSFIETIKKKVDEYVSYFYDEERGWSNPAARELCDCIKWDELDKLLEDFNSGDVYPLSYKQQ